MSSLLWAYQVWTAYGLLFDAFLNIFYAVMAVVGYWQWARTREASAAFAKTLAESHGISAMSSSEHFRVLAAGLGLSGVLYVLAKAYTTAQLAGPDAVTTVFSVLATFLLIDRKLENWLYFIVIDIAYIWIYLDRGSVVFAATFVIYTIMAIVGYRAWTVRLQQS